MAERGWWGGLLDETAKLPQGIRQLVVDAVTRQPRTDPTQPVVTPGPGGLLDLTPVPGLTEAYKATDDVGKGGYEGGQAVGKYLSGLLGIIPAVGAVRKAGPIRAYHGSPHSFDKFDLNKIGTGEGAQAYGHGLYFAENENIARSYRDALTRSKDFATTTGGRVPDWIGNSISQVESQFGRDAPLYRKIIDRHLGDFEARLADEQSALKTSTQPWNEQGRIDAISQTVDALKQLRGGGATLSPRGSMYEVGIHADPAKMIDWDKPLSQQSPEVQRALSTFGINADKAGINQFDDALLNALKGGPTTLPKQPPDPTGGAIYESSKIVPGGYRDPAVASANLKEVGIPGIKYLDRGSRAQGAGSSNYVVFDPKIIEIMRKYGLLPAAAGAAATAVPGLLNEEKQY